MLTSLAFQAHSQVFNNLEWFNNDSLLRVLAGQEGIERVNTLNHLASSLSYEDFDRSMGYAREAYDLAKKLNYEEGLAHAERNFGHVYYYDGNYPVALNHYWDALGRFEVLKNYRMVALSYKDLATAHLYGNNYDKAFELSEDAIKIFTMKDDNGKTVGNVLDTMRIRSGQGLILRNTGRSDLALKIYLKYLKLSEQYHFEITDMLVHHGLVAACYKESGKIDSALVFYRKALAFPIVNPSIEAMTIEHMRRMGEIYHLNHQADSAIRCLSAAYNWLSDAGFLMQSQMAARELGEIYQERHDYKTAESYFKAAESLLDEMIAQRSIYRFDSLKYVVSWGAELYIPWSKNIIKQFIYSRAIKTYGCMYSYYLERNNTDAALQYLQKYSASKDTMVNLTRKKEIIEIQTKFETEAKERQIENLENENLLKELQIKQNKWFMAGLAGLVILVFLFAVLLIRQNKLKHDQQTLLLQQKLLRTQMNPHFLFNSLTSIQNFIIKEKPGLASDYLSRFSKLVRQILDNSTQEFIPLEKEIDAIENYLELQKVRYRDLFDYRIDVDEDIDPETVQVPPMLAQPFIENSIEHGFKNKGSKGNLSIRFISYDSLLRVEIEDDGIGRERAKQILKQSNKHHKSLATNITRERLSALNRKSRDKISLNIEDLNDTSGNPAGTRVTLEIPN
jgi:tetratricopeptide (TPR) repeat protein